MFVLINKQHFKYYLCYMESNFTCNSGPMGKNTFSIGRMVTLVISMKRKLLYFPFFQVVITASFLFTYVLVAPQRMLAMLHK